MIFTRDGYVIFSATKPAMKMKFWHIHSMERLKRELVRWLDGDIAEGGKIQRIQQRRTTTSHATGRPNVWLEEVKPDSDVMLMMHGSDEIVLTIVIS